MADPAHDFSLTLNGRSYGGWEGIKVTRSIERMSGSFEIESAPNLNDIYLSGDLQPGEPCSIQVDGRTVLSGFVDEVEDHYTADEHAMRVTGRDKAADLIDCAASVDGPFEFSGQKLDAIALQILKPFGIKLKVDTDVGAPFERAAIKPGETAFEFLEQLCRYRAVWPLSDGVGGMVLVTPGKVASAGRLVYGQNVKTGSCSQNWQDRFSLYAVIGHADAQDASMSEDVATVPEGKATDPAVKRYRPTVIVGETQGFTVSMNDRASWQMRVNRARSTRLSYTVRRWYADPAGGALWLPNTVVPVVDPSRGINTGMLITDVTYRRGKEGTLTELKMTLPGAYELEAEAEKASIGGPA